MQQTTHSICWCKMVKMVILIFNRPYDHFMYQVVLCNCPDNNVAQAIATQLVREKLAACVNIMPGITSVYSWQEKIETDTEVMLLIKTTQNQFDRLAALINNIHPYDVPEIVSLNIQQGDNAYLNWITESLK
ncbi:divalent-cation tolerance protein CutA [Thalassotalea atypica]|uniref:divalent-cation tolerance protein CutA n=1 Tax=Thalassotalea atypica TaxID=2054316 RepID=UPI002574178C|nr:divalent-cation tolerance protein CutA [Thalassotalea atypica]